MLKFIFIYYVQKQLMLNKIFYWFIVINDNISEEQKDAKFLLKLEKQRLTFQSLISDGPLYQIKFNKASEHK